MKTSTGKATKADKRRFLALQDIGCLPCHKKGFESVPCDIHHLTDGRKRRGHQQTYGACPWHHRGHVPWQYTKQQIEEIFGPSMALSPEAYREEFGHEDDLLEYANQLLAEYECMTGLQVFDN